MAILPIDIQTILGQMNNAGRIQQNIEQSPINQQVHQGNVIHKQSEQKNKQVANLEQTENEDKKVNPDAGKEKEQELSNQKESETAEAAEVFPKEEESPSEKKNTDIFKDPDKGNLIDTKK